MRKKANSAERAGENNARTEAKARAPSSLNVAPKSSVSKPKHLSAASAPVARIASRAPKSLMKTSDLATRGSAPRRAPAARRGPAAAHRIPATALRPEPPAASRRSRSASRPRPRSLRAVLPRRPRPPRSCAASMEQIASGAEEAASASQETLAVATTTAATLVRARDRADAVRRRRKPCRGCCWRPRTRSAHGPATSSTMASARPARSPSSSS